MKITNYILSIGFISASALIPLNGMAQINVEVGHRQGLCIFTIPSVVVPETEKNMKLEFTYRVSDGTTRWALLVNGWPKAQNADPDYDFPVSLTFDTGAKTSSASGGYSSGFNDSLWGIWDAGDSSNELLSMLKGASSVEIEADGMNFGNTDLQGEGMIYNLINKCAVDKRADGS